MKRSFLWLLMAAAALLPQGLRAQGYFTLTNGHYYWYDGADCSNTSDKYLTGFDKTQDSVEIYTLPPHSGTNTTIVTEKGDVYLALDLTNPASPAIAATTTFSPRCVWWRTGSTGYYRQTVDGYDYYLVGTHANGLRVVRVAQNAPLNEKTTWYNWDFGAAVTEVVKIDGVDKERYYWMMYDNLNEEDGTTLANGQWRLSSVSSYQRPEEIIYNGFNANPALNSPAAGGNMTYYDNVFVSATGMNYPAGNGAHYMPVTVTEYSKEPIGSTNLSGVTSSMGATTTLEYLDEVTLTANMSGSSAQVQGTADYTMTFRKPYVKYDEEILRCGINLNGSERTTEGFNHAGEPTTVVSYNLDGTQYSESAFAALPTSTTQDQENVHVTDYEFSVPAHYRRYITFTEVTGHKEQRVMSVSSPAPGDYTVTVTVTVNYSNGTSETATLDVDLRKYTKPETVAQAKNGPVIKHYLCGGARMANVEGNTNVTIHNADTVYAVYGGNDIAGWVQGEGGATLQIGTTRTSEERPVHAGYVYGGGCGYYTYQGISIGKDENGNTIDPYVYNGGRSNLEYQAYFFNGKVYKWNSLPADYETHANQVISRMDEEAAHPGTYTGEQILSGYYDAAWNDADLVVDTFFSYVPYFYCDESDPSNPHTVVNTSESTATVDNTEDGNGSACMANTDFMGTIPYVKTSHITIGVPEVVGHLITDNTGLGASTPDYVAHNFNEYILIDSLFGGAENSFIGVTSDVGNYASGITLDINGGKILAAFGGNNYGGAVATKSTVTVNVHCTSLTGTDPGENDLYHGYGRDFGIRTLFGGGNLVDAYHASVNIYGGMIDTVFLGGNQATVRNPIGLVECKMDAEHLDAFGHFGHLIYTNPALTEADFANNGINVTNYHPDQGRYNIRTLFGGNNKAPMNNFSFMMLHSGGINTVYGGGNEGDMNNEGPIAMQDPHFGDLSFAQAILVQSLQGSLSPVPPKTCALVAVLPDATIKMDYLYGGCRKANVKNSCGIYLSGGMVGTLFGGNDISGDIGTTSKEGASYVVVTGNAVVQGNVFGGSDGYYHCEAKTTEGASTRRYDDTKIIEDVFGNGIDNDPFNEYTGLLFPTQNRTNVHISGGTIKGNVVGGGMKASVGFDNQESIPYYIHYATTGTDDPLAVTRQTGVVTLSISGSPHIMGNVFGGGSQASVYGISQMVVDGTPVIDGGVFAANDCLGQVGSFAPYTMNQMPDYTGCANASDSAARDAAFYTDAFYESITSSNGDQLNWKDGGTWKSRYTGYLHIKGNPMINSVYGAGNGAYDYDGTRPHFPEVFVCEGEMDRPDQASTFIDINTAGGYIDTVYGGGAGSTVTGEVVILLNNQSLDNSTYVAPGSAVASGTMPYTADRHHWRSDATHQQNFVGTIFGGNNFDAMNTCVPEIRLVQGNVMNVYGGSNSGDMNYTKTFVDVCGNDVEGVSTHVLVVNDAVTVTDSLFGGNRMSDIAGMAYVDIRATSTEGINYVYGGNDIGGRVKTNTRIDVSGGKVHRIWGGSNGRYDYVPVGYNEFKIYPFGTTTTGNPADSAGKLITIAAEPNVDSTNVNLWGGELTQSVFAGGSMAESNATLLVVDEAASCGSNELMVSGTFYGGGEGRWDDLNLLNHNGTRFGNVNGTSHVHLKSADNAGILLVYGGGGGGDVQNTDVQVFDTWTENVTSIFAGCWGSDVHGTARLQYDGSGSVATLYGGNDFTGNVYRSEMIINNGTFGEVYGAGNGAYPDSYYVTQHANALLPQFAYQGASATAYANGKWMRRPNNERVELTFNGGTVTGNLYGGGREGSLFNYKKDPSTREYIYSRNVAEVCVPDYAAGDGVDGIDRMVPDTTMAYNQAHTNPEDYGYAIVNIHGGTFRNNVYGGAKGDGLDNTILVYGFKEVNMDGGYIRSSLYGGSQSVNDGYYHEIVEGSLDATHSTMRPTSVVNITGGTIDHNVYGGGYGGTVFGSTYVNVGIEAIDSCVAYTKTINGVDSAYALFKPGVSGSLADNLTKTDLLLNHSIYSGSDWGEGTSGSADFTTPGYYGGESMMYIDGKGYNTAADPLSSDPQMNIAKSLFGSGTSVAGGDKRTDIELRNYGAMVNCAPTKILESVQRVQRFLSHNTAVEYMGATDATTAYQSEPFSLNVITDSLVFRGFNVAQYDAKVEEVANVYFYEEAKVANNLVLVPVQTLRQQNGGAYACDVNDPDYLCANGSVVDATTSGMQHTLFILNNGIDFNIGTSGGGGTFTVGKVYGFGYVTSTPNFSSSIIAEATNIDGHSYMPGSSWEDGYSGFVSPCEDTNKLAVDRGASSVAWGDAEGSVNAEYPFTNFASDMYYGDYREWKVGVGTRLREATILAHSDPTKLPELDANVILGVSPRDLNLAVAMASIELPPSEDGHYYRLDGSKGITLSGENSSMTLVDSAWYPNVPYDSWTPTMDMPALQAEYELSNNVNSQGRWFRSSLGEGGVYQGLDEITNNPINTFGLVMAPGDHFSTNVMPDPGYTPPHPVMAEDTRLVLSGNTYVNSSGVYASPVVTGGTRIKPVMNLMLTYDPSFNSTFFGTVDFTLLEYDASNNLVGPVQLKVYVSTIISDFRDIDETVLAMFNNGTRNNFKRKLFLPMTLDENRDIYITSVRWVPTDINGGDSLGAEATSRFKMVDNQEHVLGENPLTHSYFGMTLQPTDDAGETSEAIGWVEKIATPINIYDLAYNSYSNAHMTSRSDNTATKVDLCSTPGDPTTGVRIGTHDARGVQALDVNLLFDGFRVYDYRPGKGFVGKVELEMAAVSLSASPTPTKEFKITVNVKTREHGDTIYVASANSVTRGGRTVTPYTSNPTYTGATPEQRIMMANKIGKSPSWYVNTFEQALSSNVYQEGDVVAVLDTVYINDRRVSIQGRDGSPIEVIRYEGHHREMPGEDGVYRGPMISVGQDNLGHNGSFSAQYITFHGSAGARITKVDGLGNLAQAVSPDTNRAQGPIIQIVGGGDVLLQNGVDVLHNWNTADGSDSKLMGAISVTDGGVLTLKNNVNFLGNLSATLAGDPAVQPMNGAVYIDGGRMVLPESMDGSGVVIQKNYLVPNTDPASWTASDDWWNPVDVNNDGINDRWALDTNDFADAQKANVFLTRTPMPAPSGVTGEAATRFEELNDDMTDVIEVTGPLGDSTLIGVRKWFPGINTRDTIRFAVASGSNLQVLSNAVNVNHNFTSDDNNRIFYNSMVNNTTAYFFRCNTFHHQLASDPILLTDEHGHTINIATRDVMQYEPLNSACPVGGDKLIYSVQGGFMPYTYHWTSASDLVERTHTSPYYNTQVQHDLWDDESLPVEDRIVKYNASAHDTLILPYLNFGNSTNKTESFTVTVTDATGECQLSKDIVINLAMDHNAPNLIEYVEDVDVSPSVSTMPDYGWMDTASVVTANRVKAVANRNFPGIQVTPMVWVDRDAGTISAVVGSPSNDDWVIYNWNETGDYHDLENVAFCEGDLIYLNTKPAGGNTQFLMWDFDPYYNPRATYTVPPHDATVIAYYGPGDYWKDVVNTTAIAGAHLDDNFNFENHESYGYVTTYHGDVHIYNENGLAWLISVVNGLNGNQIRPFYFNRVFIHQKDDGTPYDMKDHLWTPVGSTQYGFRGRLIGVPGSSDHSNDSVTTPLPAGEYVQINNIIVNEPALYNAGFFGNLDTARVSGIKLQSLFVRGGQYVGGMAGRSVYSRFDNCSVTSDDGTAATTTILTSHYASGGFIGQSDRDTVQNSEFRAKFVGDLVYSGGVVGRGTASQVNNTTGMNISRLNALYVGGLAGWLDGVAPVSRLFRSKTSGEPSRLINNYVHVLAEGHAQRMGGMVGYAENAVIENNYAYGDIEGTMPSGGVAGAMGNNARADHSYYADSDAPQAVGATQGNVSMSDLASFSGSGNQVAISQPVYGVNNLTRVLNIWVREHNADGGNYRTWRSDLEGVNNGYPLFGEPDLIPVSGTQYLEGCEEVVINGVSYTTDSSFTVHFIDSVQMVDSTLTAHIIIHHGEHIALSDTAVVGEEYSGHGFYVSTVESELLQQALDSTGHATLVLTDTLQNSFGCDSIVTLTLTFSGTPGVVDVEESPDVHVYPNPTVNVVHVEAEGMTHVEVYDNEGRVLQNRDVENGAVSTTLDLSYYASGIYYIRVHTPTTITIQKVVKR